MRLGKPMVGHASDGDGMGKRMMIEIAMKLRKGRVYDESSC